MEELGRPRSRAWRFAVLILAVAAILWAWKSYSDSKAQAEVQHYVEMIAAAAGEGRSALRTALGNSNRAIADSVVRILESAPSDPERLEYTIVRGDDPLIGDGSATHRAIFSIDHRPTIELRLLHSRGSNSVQILGCTDLSAMQASSDTLPP